ELPGEKFVARAREYFHSHSAAHATSAALAADDAYFREVMLLSQPKIKGIEELPAYTSYFFTEDFPIDAKVRDKLMSKGDPKARLRELLDALPAMDFSNDAAIEDGLKSLASQHGLAFGDFQAGARLA